jgi:hypothetical protein
MERAETSGCCGRNSGYKKDSYIKLNSGFGRLRGELIVHQEKLERIFGICLE